MQPAFCPYLYWELAFVRQLRRTTREGLRTWSSLDIVTDSDLTEKISIILA